MIAMDSAWKRRAALAVDGGLALASRMSRRRQAASTLPPHPRVLVVRCDHIGDAVMSTAVLPALRSALHPAALDVLVASWAAPLFEAHPAVDRVHVYDAPWWLAARRAPRTRRLAAWIGLPGVIHALRGCRYDVAIDLRGDLRQILCFLTLSGAAERASSDRTGGVSLLTRCWHDDQSLHEVEKNAAIVAMLGAAGAGRLSPPARLELPLDLTPDELRVLAAGFIALAPCGNKPNRSWPVGHAARLAELIATRLRMGVAFVGGEGERAFGDAVRAAAPKAVVNLAGRCNLLESCGAIARAAAVIAVDSGPMHLAALVDAPVLALFGAGDERRFRPWTDRHRIVRTPARCTCRGVACDLTRSGEGACMTDLTADAVFDALVGMLGAATKGYASADLQPVGYFPPRPRAGEERRWVH